MRAVNLLPRETKQPRKRPSAVGQLSLVAPFVVAGLLVAGYMLAGSSVNSHRSTLRALQDELASLPVPKAQEPQQNPALASERQLRIATLGAALQSRLVWDRVFREISAVLPADVWLTTMSAQTRRRRPPCRRRRPPPPAPSSRRADGHDDHRDHRPQPPRPPRRRLATGADDLRRLHVLTGDESPGCSVAWQSLPALQNVKLVSSSEATWEARRSSPLDRGRRPASGDGMSKQRTEVKVASARPRGSARLVAVRGSWSSRLNGTDAADLKQQIADTRDQISVAQGVRTPTAPPSIRVADLFKLSRAMPNTADIPGVMLQLSGVAAETGVKFESITPHDPVSYGAYQQVSVDLSFEGRFYDLSDFLYRLRNLVGVHQGVLDATGRLFTVDKISFSQGAESFPQVKASLTVSAYVFGDGTAPPVPSGVTSGGSAPTSPAIENTQRSRLRRPVPRRWGHEPRVRQVAGREARPAPENLHRRRVGSPARGPRLRAAEDDGW
jgi:Tfp pilus assembly protein PilO